MMIRRRALLRFVAVILIAASANGLAQTKSKVYRLGYASFRAGPSTLDEAFVQGLRELGYLCSVADLIQLRVKRAIECGCDGIITAPHDNPNRIRELAGAPGLLIATPGVRLAGSSVDDHKRPGTPAQALSAGADYLVIGRPIVRSDDPARAATAIIENMRSVA